MALSGLGLPGIGIDDLEHVAVGILEEKSLERRGAFGRYNADALRLEALLKGFDVEGGDKEGKVAPELAFEIGSFKKFAAENVELLPAADVHPADFNRRV